MLVENVVIKSCSNCKSTKTPLWRAGPTGPKSLCNACGIKYRKRKDGLTWGIKDRFKEKYQRRNKINTTTGCGHNDDEESGCGEKMGENLKVRVVELGKELVVLSRKPRSPTKRRRSDHHTKKLGEVEEAAAVVLMALSCG